MILLRNTLILWLASNASAFLAGGPIGRPTSLHSLDTLRVSLSESNEVESTDVEIDVTEAGAAEVSDSPVSDVVSEIAETESTDDGEKEKSSKDVDRHTVYVGNLPYSVEVNDIKELFAEHVTVGYVNLPRDRETGKFKGFAFVDVSADDEIPKAIEALNGIEIEGRKLRVNRYLAKDQIRSAKTVDDGTKKLYVGNLPYKASKDDVTDYFAEFGEILDVFLPVNNYGDPRGFGFISVKDEDLDKVLEATNGAEFMGRNLVVNLPLPPGEKTQRKPRQQNIKLFVGNLSFFTQGETLEEVFEEFGTVVDCYIPTDMNNGNSRGFGFVTMEKDAAYAAIDALDGCELDGRMISVNEAKPRGAKRDTFNDKSDDFGSEE